MLTWQQLKEKVRKEIREAPTSQMYEDLRRGENIVIIDVREADEFIDRHVPSALFIPRGFLELRIENTVPDREQRIYVYCGGGNRSVLAARSLQEMGYKNVFTLAGGFSQWLREGRPIELPREREEE